MNALKRSNRRPQHLAAEELCQTLNVAAENFLGTVEYEQTA